MPTITSALTPSPTGINLTSGIGGGGVVGSVTGSGTGVISPSYSFTGGSGSASSIAASIGQATGAGAGGRSIEGAFYDQRLAQIYYLGDKPWSDESRYDDPAFDLNGPPSNAGKLKTTLILLAALCLAKNL